MAGKGWTWTSQRCGRYEYRKVLTHSTNPDHLVPSAARGSGGFLRVAARYAAGQEAMQYHQLRILCALRDKICWSRHRSCAG